MPGLRFGERLVVFVGIGVCAVFDWLKCRVTREKADIGPSEPLTWPDGPVAQPPIRFGDRVLGTDGMWHASPARKFHEGPISEHEYAARLKWYGAAGPVGAAVVTGRLLADSPRRSGKTAAMEAELNAYLAADKAETLGEYGDRMRAKFTPEYLKRIAEGLEPGRYDRATGEFFPPPGYDSPEGRRARNIQGGGF